MSQIGFEKTSLTLDNINVPNDMEQLIKYEQLIKTNPKNIAFHLNKNPDTRNAISCITGRRVDYRNEGFKFEPNPSALSEEPNTRQLQMFLYQNLGIDINTDNNNPLKKFSKGVIDGLIVGNLELVMKIIEVGPQKFLETLSKELLSLDGLKKIAEGLGKTVVELLSFDSYKTGKSVSELGLITTGAGAIGWGAKKIGKEAIILSGKIGSKTVIKKGISSSIYMTGRTLEGTGSVLQIPTKVAGKATELIGSDTGLTAVAGSAIEGLKEIVNKSEIVKLVKGKVADIIEGRQLKRAETLELEGKLIDSSKLDLQFYDTPEKLNTLKQRLGLSETATTNEIEQMYKLKLYDTMVRYETLGKDNLSRVSRELIYEMRKSGERNPQQVILDEIRSVNEAFRKGEIKIVRIDDINKGNIDIRSEIIKDGFKSPYQINNNTWGDIGMNSYGKMREGVYKDMKVYGLDPKYGTFLVNKKELDDLIKKYGKDNPMISILDINQLQRKAGITMHDTLLYARTSIAGVDQYMFGIEDLLNVRALKNLENKYNAQYKQLLSSAKQNAKAKWEIRMYDGMSKETSFMEVQIFGQLGPPKEHYIGTSINTIFNK